MNLEWLEPSDRDKYESDNIHLRQMRNEVYKERLLLDDHQRRVGLDLETLSRQVGELREGNEKQELLKRKDMAAVNDAIASFAQESKLAHMHKLESQREYSNFLNMQVGERMEDVPEESTGTVMEGEDPNETWARHRREVSQLQSQMLLAQMAESTTSSVFEPDILVICPESNAQRQLLLDSRRKLRMELDHANRAMSQSKSIRTVTEKSPPFAASPIMSQHPTLRTDFKGVSAEDYRTFLAENDSLVKQKQKEYSQRMEEERRLQEIATNEARKTEERLAKEALWRKEQKKECDDSVRRMCPKDDVLPPDKYVSDFFDKRFGNSLT